VPILREALRDPDATLRRLAAGALSNIGPEAAPAVPDLIRALSDDEPEVRSGAARALARIGPKAESAVPHLIKNLDRKQPDLVRRFSCEALSRIGEGLKPFVPDILRTLRDDPDAYVRQRAVWALGRLSGDDLERSGAVEAMVATFAEQSDDTVLVRYEAARYLAMILGPTAPEKCIGVLLAMLKDTRLQVYTRTDTKVSTAGTETGGGSSEAKANLGGDARFMPVEALGRMGARANRPDVIKALEEASRATDPKLKEAAKEALKKIKG
jgi:HEAT repeat protein